MRIAVDIDSTLHHHWDLLSEAARRRFGIDLPYDEQLTWGSTRLRECQLEVCINETQTDAAILAAKPYPGAVEAVRAWHEAGHFVLIASHRPGGCSAATERWLEAIGIPHDALECGPGKLERCKALGVELLVDDAPQNLRDAIEAGMVAATIEHPWNEDVVAEEDVVAAPDWPSLDRLLRARLPALGERATSAA